MNDEPELIDLFAMFAMHAYIRGPQHEMGPEEVANAAYEVATEMMRAKGEYVD
jgi:hypothetical protein